MIVERTMRGVLKRSPLVDNARGLEYEVLVGSLTVAWSQALNLNWAHATGVVRVLVVSGYSNAVDIEVV